MIVVVQPKFVIEILVGVASLEWIQSPLRLVPNRGNLGDGIPTPHYNHAILEDAHERRLSATWSGHGHGHGGASANASTEMSAAATCAIRQAGILAKVWCLQRGLLRGHDAMHESHIVVLMLYMLRSKRVNPRLAPTQILAAWFKLLAETDWMGEKEALLSASAANETANNLIRKAPSEAYRNGAGHGLRRRTVLVVPQAGVTESSTIAQSSLAQLYEQHTRESPLTESDPPTLVELYRQTTAISAVMLDPTLTYNYLARWSPSFVRLLQREAAKSLEYCSRPPRPRTRTCSCVRCASGRGTMPTCAFASPKLFRQCRAIITTPTTIVRLRARRWTGRGCGAAPISWTLGPMNAYREESYAC
jgi:hypothetical protein